MTFRLFVDSSTGVDVEPEWEYSELDAKIEDVHRSMSGKRYHYKWGEYARRSVPVMFVDSAFRETVNTWWRENEDLLWMEEGGTEVFSMRIVNQSLPISTVMRPYMDQFAGVIELETY